MFEEIMAENVPTPGRDLTSKFMRLMNSKISLAEDSSAETLQASGKGGDISVQELEETAT